VRGQRHAPAALYPRERPGTHCTGGCVGSRAGLDRCGKSRHPPGSDPRTVQPVVSRYTVYATRPTLTGQAHRYLQWTYKIGKTKSLRISLEKNLKGNLKRRISRYFFEHRWPKWSVGLLWELNDALDQIRWPRPPVKQKEQEQNVSAPNCCHWFEWLIPFTVLSRSLIFLPHDGASYYCCINHPLRMGMSLLCGVQWRPYLYLSAGGNLLWFFSRRKALCHRKKRNSVDCFQRLLWTVKKCSLLMKFLTIITRPLTSLLAYLDSPVSICLKKKTDIFGRRG